MKMFRRLLLTVCALLLFPAMLPADEVGAPPVLTTLSPVSVNAAFVHAKTRPRYASAWKGTVHLAVSSTESEAITAELRIGVGSEPSRLASHWYPLDSNDSSSIGTPQTPIVLAAKDTSSSEVSAWIRMRSMHNPSLVITLVPRADNPLLDTGVEYTNPNVVRGVVYILDETDDGLEVRRYANLVIPKNAISFTSRPTDDGEQVIAMTSSLFELTNIARPVSCRFLRRCRNHRNRGSAKSIDFTVQSMSPSSEPAAIHTITDNVRATLVDLAISDLLTRAQLRKSMRQLDKVQAFSKKAKSVEALSEMVSMEKQWENLAETGAVPADIAVPLLDIIKSITLELVKTKVSIADLSMTLSPPGPDWTIRWNVDQSVTYPTPSGETEPTGSAALPFTSIAQALEKADDLDIEDVTLLVQSGVYREPLLITRATTLNAVAGGTCLITETILNLSPVVLRINGFYLIGATSPGAVLVDNADAFTGISNTVVQDAVRFGIYQNGGEMILNDVQVYRTNTDLGYRTFGTGIYLRSGAHGFFQDVISSNNKSFGMFIEGDGTQVIATNLTVNQNILNRRFADEYAADPTNPSWTFGGIWVNDHATATFSVLRMGHNEGDSVAVTNHASAVISDAVILNTDYYEPDGGWGGSSRYGGGNAIRVRSGGYVQITNFTLTHATLAGLLIGEEGTADASYGEISYNPIGAAIFNSAFDYLRITDHVRYKENGTNLQTESLPIPDPGL